MTGKDTLQETVATLISRRSGKILCCETVAALHVIALGRAARASLMIRREGDAV